MRASVIILLMATCQACQYHELGMSATLPKAIPLQPGCLTNAKTIQPIIDQIGTIIHFEKMNFISLPPPYMDNINYLPCNLPNSVGDGQKVRFSAKVKYQPEIINGAVVDYIGQEIELTQLTLL